MKESVGSKQVQKEGENRTKPYGDGEPVSDADGLGSAPNLADNPGGNLETVASSEPEKKPGKSRKSESIYRAYRPAECLDGWRLIVLGDRGRRGPDDLSKPGKSDIPNKNLLMYWHVERFIFEAGEDWRGDLEQWAKAATKAEREDDAILWLMAAFSEWYQANPFYLRQPLDESGKRVMPELEPITVVEACKARKIPHNRVLKALSRERQAIREGKPAPPTPAIWKEKGSPAMTTLAELDKWIAKEKLSESAKA